MRTVRVVPCLDVEGGRVVKGVGFVGLRDAGDPVELARRYADSGADEVVFLDISASSDEREILLGVVEETAAAVFIPFTVGGGVRGVEDARRILSAGADKVAVNTAAVSDPGIVAELAATFGSQCVVVAIDAKRSELGFEVHTHGGRRASGVEAVAWAAQVAELGAGELLVTSIDRDGTGAGYDLELVAAVAEAAPVPLVASGGVGKVADLVDGAKAGADAVLVASLFHDGHADVATAKAALAAGGFAVRPVSS